MSCKNKNTHDAWNTVLTIGGGIAIGTVGVAAVVAAPLEIGLTIALLGATKYALDKHNEHKHDEEIITPEPAADTTSDS